MTKVNDPAHPKHQIKGCAWRYYSAGKDGRGRKVEFGWTTQRNPAGFFVAFRYVEDSKTKQTTFYESVARKVRAEAKAWTQTKCDEFVVNKLNRAGLTNHVRLRNAVASRSALTKWLSEDRTGKGGMELTAEAVIYAFEDPNTAFEFKMAFG